ncbi:hypothetical protein [Streptomyces sp. NPDC002889]|uniref:hypothetical protein n=1 Tax=Streptomyces sp. NPDC002889 TaxID=3364669 RepID=UPI003683A899
MGSSLDGVQLGLRFEGRRAARWRPLADVVLQEVAQAEPWRRHVTHQGEQPRFGQFAAISRAW